MAQYRCSIHEAISRGKGQSAVAKAAYNAREKLRDERTGEMKDYSRNKDDILFSAIFVDPKRNAPEWTKDRAALWNAAVAAEKRMDAREAQEIIVNLPHELTDQQRRFMLTDFVREQITRGTGRIADVNIHRPPEHGDDRNHHAHILMTVREIGPDGFGKQRLEVTPEQILRWKEKWAERGAKELRKAGFEIEADRWSVGHLNLERQRQAALERGDLAYAATLDREPTKHRGPAVSAMERKGMETDRGNIERETYTAAQETAKLRAELAQIEKEIRREELAWEDQLAKAAIEKEKIERRFIEPDHQAVREARAGQDWPVMPPQPELVRTSPAHHFEDAAREAAYDHRPQDAPDHLRGTSAEIWLAYHRSDNAKAFAAALDEKGIALAVVTKDEAERSRTDAAAAKEQGKYAPVYRENEIVAVDDRAYVYRLNDRTTGSAFGDMQRYLRTLDRSPLQGITGTRQMMQDRAAERGAAVQVFAALNPVTRAERSTGGSGSLTRGVLADAAKITNTIASKPRLVKAPLRILGKTLDSAAKAAEGIVSMFDPGPPKTRAELEIIAEERERHGRAAAKEAAAAQHWQAYTDEYEQIAAKHEEQAREAQQRDDQYKRQRERERER